jgi:hypothetical protein
MVMGGVFNDGRWPSNIARILNRAYVFPNLRRRSIPQLINGYELLHHHMIYPLIAINNYDCYFVTMQNRDKKPTKRWWDIWRYTMNEASNNFWTESSGYVQTYNINKQTCWQNFVYHEYVPGTFTLPVITQAEWNLLEPG